jgi:acetoin:2,6-dichlorophenolindophenol oxidoreductase subunit beta
MGDALRAALNEDDRVILLGEDLVDPYGGAFKVTRGLSTDFPGRVRSTPISEGAIAGLSAGLALSGYRPIAEIMFGDFLTRSSTTSPSTRRCTTARRPAR